METIRKATKATYDEMPRIFGALQLCRSVRRKLQRQTMDGTILRRLRELRADGETPYEVFDSQQAKYIKK